MVQMRMPYRYFRPHQKKNSFREDNAELVRRVQLGEQAARSELILKNMPLIWKIARRYVGQGVDYDDLIQAGRLGIDHAASKFEFHKNIAFSTYVTFWIRSYIQTEMHNHKSDIRVNSHVQEAMVKIDRFCAAYYLQYGHYPTDQETIDQLKVKSQEDYKKKHGRVLSQKQINRYLQPFPEAFICRQQKFVRESDSTLRNWDDCMLADLDQPSPEDKLMAKEALRRLHKIKTSIDERAAKFSAIEKIILYTRLWQRDKNLEVEDKVTLREIGTKFNLSRERVRKIEEGLCLKIFKAYHLDKAALACLPDVILDFAARVGG